MTVHFVYRSHYEGPSGKHVARLEAASVLDWFQTIWPQAVAAEEPAAWVKDTLGCAALGFESLFEKARELALPAPENDAQLLHYLNEHLYVEGEIIAAPHCVQALTDDDETEVAYYFFDDAFRQDNPRSTAFLLHEGWELPETAFNDWYQAETATRLLTPSGAGEGSVYLAFLTFHDALNLSEPAPPCRVGGVRLPELCGWLRQATPTTDWPFELRLLRGQLDEDARGADGLKSALLACNRFPVLPVRQGDDAATLGLGDRDTARAAFAECLDRLPEKQRPNKPKKSQVQVSDHLAQLCLHVGRSGKSDLYHRWVLFDEQWAAANKPLANGLLRYARRWDVLSAV